MSQEKIKTTIPLAVIDRIMRENLPTKKISKEAKIEFDKVIVKLAKVVCENANTSTDNAKRKTVKAEDITFD